MEIDFAIHEFEEEDITPPYDNLTDIIVKLMDNPEMVQPIRAISSETHQPISTFYMSIVLDEDHLFLQLEGFSSKDYEKIIINSFQDPDKWTVVQPGIVRLKILE